MAETLTNEQIAEGMPSVHLLLAGYPFHALSSDEEALAIERTGSAREECRSALTELLAARAKLAAYAERDKRLEGLEAKWRELEVSDDWGSSFSPTQAADELAAILDSERT